MTPLSESQIQEQIKEALKAMGCIVLDTSARGSARVMRTARQTGTSKGIPDLLISHASWAPLWLGIEVKDAKGTLKPEQKQLLDLGRIVIARSVEDALEAVRAMRKDAA